MTILHPISMISALRNAFLAQRDGFARLKAATERGAATCADMALTDEGRCEARAADCPDPCPWESFPGPVLQDPRDGGAAGAAG